MKTISYLLKLFILSVHLIYPQYNSKIDGLSVVIQRDNLQKALMGDLGLIKHITNKISEDLSMHENTNEHKQLTRLINDTNSHLKSILEDNLKKKKANTSLNVKSLQLFLCFVANQMR